jgi:hypothetical protein
MSPCTILSCRLRRHGATFPKAHPMISALPGTEHTVVRPSHVCWHASARRLCVRAIKSSEPGSNQIVRSITSANAVSSSQMRLPKVHPRMHKHGDTCDCTARPAGAVIHLPRRARTRNGRGYEERCQRSKHSFMKASITPGPCFDPHVKGCM